MVATYPLSKASAFLEIRPTDEEYRNAFQRNLGTMHQKLLASLQAQLGSPEHTLSNVEMVGISGWSQNYWQMQYGMLGRGIAEYLGLEDRQITYRRVGTANQQWARDHPIISTYWSVAIAAENGASGVLFWTLYPEVVQALNHSSLSIHAQA